MNSRIIMCKKPRAGVGVLLLRNGKVLLGKRNPDPEKAGSELHGEGTWTLPGGSMEFGESFQEAVYREVLEETGIKVNKDKIRLVSVTNDIGKDAHFVTLGFLCEEFDGEPEVREEDIIEWRWFSLNDLPLPLFPPSEKLIKNYLEKTIWKH